MTRYAAGALLLLCACSDPYEPAFGDSFCRDGMTLDQGACTAPKRVVKIDGQFDDWSGLTQLQAPTSGAGLMLARDGDAGLLVRILTNGAPETGPNAVYDLQLVTDAYVVHVGLGTDAGWFYQEGSVDQQLGASPAIVAFGADGLEARVPIDVLPLHGEAHVDVEVFHRTKGSDFTGAGTSTELGPIDCWDPKNRFNGCAYH